MTVFTPVRRLSAVGTLAAGRADLAAGSAGTGGARRVSLPVALGRRVAVPPISRLRPAGRPLDSSLHAARDGRRPAADVPALGPAARDVESKRNPEETQLDAEITILDPHCRPARSRRVTRSVRNAARNPTRRTEKSLKS